MPQKSRADGTLMLPLTRSAVCFRRTRLLVTPSAGDPHEHLVELPAIFIGSDPANDVCVDDPHVSRRHCEIRQTPGGFLVRDLGSMNGTFASGLALHEAVLPPGSTITVGQTQIRLLGDQAQPEIAPSAVERFGGVVGGSLRMRRIFGLLEKVAPTDLTITFIGETGTGKELFARAVHEHSRRAQGPFVVIDCSAVAPSLIESELFGHQKGAFTGADRSRAGAFERADGGTVFLDEIGELPLDLQPKLLRALEQRAVKPIGGPREIPIDVRIIAATNRNLEAEAQAGRFRDDLFFRLSVVTVDIPPLRDRRDDVPLLVQQFIEQRGATVRLADETLEVLSAHDWPGNVRELRNVIESALAVLDGATLQPDDLVFFRPRHGEPESRSAATPDELNLAGLRLESLERAAIAQTLTQCGGNKTAAARALGIAPSTLYEKIKKYGLGQD